MKQQEPNSSILKDTRRTTAGSRGMRPSPSTMLPQSCRSGKRELLFEQEMLTVDVLNDDCATGLKRQNDWLKIALNQRHFQLQQRTKQREGLAKQLETLRRENADYEAHFSARRCSQLDTETEQTEGVIFGAEMDRAALEHMLERERLTRLNLAMNIEGLKQRLKRADDLAVDANNAKKGADQRKIEQEQRTDCKTDLEAVETIKMKIAEGSRLNESILREVEESKRRIKEEELAVQRTASREARQQVVISQLKERLLYHAELKHKLERYRAEFIKEFERLKGVYSATQKSEIMDKKESQDIRLQSERNIWQEKLAMLKSRQETYYDLLQDRDKAKAEYMKRPRYVQAQKAIDCGEYNQDAASKRYVQNRDGLFQLNSAVEEKLGLLRSVTSGIKHIIFTLKSQDRETETGTWYDLHVVAAIEDISLEGTAPKFSRLLLILEQKLSAIIFLVIQKIMHIESVKHNMVIPAENPLDRQAVAPVYIMVNGMSRCCDLLNFYLKRSNSVVPLLEGETAKSHRDSVVVQTFANEAGADDSEGDLGRFIMEPDTPPKATTNNSKAYIGIQKREEAPKNTGDIDMLALNEHIFDVSKRKTTRYRNLDITRVTGPTEDEVKEQSALSERFAKEREQLRLARVMTQRAGNMSARVSSELTPVTTNFSKKKRLSKLTLEVATAMRRRPPELVGVATTTFDALDRIRKFDSMKLKRELEENQKLFPNFLDVILNMKKSRNDEKIGRIAAKCSYFLDQPTTTAPACRPSHYATTQLLPAAAPHRPPTVLPGSSTSRTKFAHYMSQRVRPGVSARTKAEEFSMTNMQKRIQNLKSLDQLDQCPAALPQTNAFDTFCGKAVPAQKLTHNFSNVSSTLSRKSSQAHIMPSIKKKPQTEAGRRDNNKREKMLANIHFNTIEAFAPPDPNDRLAIIKDVISSISLAFIQRSKAQAQS